MKKDKNDLKYDFDEYLRQDEPRQRERAESWKTAIGLQAVDGLKLLGEHNELKNRYLLAGASTDRVPDKHPARTPQITRKLDTVSPDVIRLIQGIGESEISVKEMLVALNLRDRKNLVTTYLEPAIQSGFIRQLYQDKPKHPRQKYLLTAKGLALHMEVKK